MKALIAFLICLAAATSPLSAQLNRDIVTTAQKPGSDGTSPGGEAGLDSQAALLDRIKKLETLVTALQHENDVLRKKLEETRSK